MEGRVADRQLEAYAKSQGFPSHAAMVAYYRQRSEGLQQPGGGGSRSSMSLPMIHPKQLLDYVLEKYRNATGT